jgi:hypothetical protein
VRRRSDRFDAAIGSVRIDHPGANRDLVQDATAPLEKRGAAAKSVIPMEILMEIGISAPALHVSGLHVSGSSPAAPSS